MRCAGFAFAGIWEFIQLDGEEILSATIVVGEPNPLVC
jgi:putative SOS response-associated peptidase YedK